jgi:glucosyl-3-phosphoglycerate synthase
MPDFSQKGVITSLHNVVERSVPELESELAGYAHRRPMSLLLFASAKVTSDGASPVLGDTSRGLRHASYLTEVVIGLERADRHQFRRMLDSLASLPQRRRVVWSDGPRVREIDKQLCAAGLVSPEGRRARALWYSLGYVLASNRAEVVAMLTPRRRCDSTIASHRALLAKLFYPLANPAFTFEFCKGYFSTVEASRQTARLECLLMAPLIRALAAVFGPHDYLIYLDSFHSCLASEAAFRRFVLPRLRLPMGIADPSAVQLCLLSDLQRNLAGNHICQTDIAFPGNKTATDESVNFGGDAEMIVRILFEHVTREGLVIDDPTLQTLKVTYHRLALDFLQASRCDSLANGLTFDTHSEEQVIEDFAGAIYKAGKRNSGVSPCLPSWDCATSAVPDILPRLYDAVESDHREFSRPAVFISCARPSGRNLHASV